jgi:cytochrome c556
MKFLKKSLVAGLVLMAGVAFAETEATNPEVIARQDAMKAQGGAMKTLGGMAGGEMAFDAAAAAAAKATLMASAEAIAANFTNNPEDPGSEAKPEIWTNWDDFVAKGKALSDAAAALDTSSVESIGAGMGALGGACKACHTAYRI